MDRLSRLARWLGLDRNPLRRRSDRVECGVRMIAFVGTLLAVIAGVVMGLRAYEAGLRTEAQQARERVPVSATLTRDVVTLGEEGQALRGVPVRWRAPDGTEHQGVVAAHGARRAGETVTIWVDRRGEPTTPPQGRETTLAGALAAGAGLPLTAGALLSLAVVTVRMINIRRSARRWEAQWSAVEPAWRKLT